MADKPYDNGFRFNKPVRESPGAAKARLYRYHKAAGSMGAYYDQFPLTKQKRERVDQKLKRMGHEPERKHEMDRGGR